MLITELELQNFRNYEKQKIEFNNNINIFYGDNAQGKTNIIESIFISAFGKSFRTSREKELIKYNEDFLNINLKYKNSSREGYIKVQIADKKNVIVNGIKIKKLVREVCMQKGIKNIKQIKMPILIPAVDIYTDELCVFSNNINKEIKSRVNYINDIDIGTAVQASCSYPGIFSPCPFNNKLFVDGGITENLPWKETKKAGANKVLSIVFEDKEPKKCCNNIFEIINKSFSLLCKELARYELDGTDYLLKIKTNRVGLLEKSKMQELYEEGYIQTKKMLQNNILIN